MILETLATIEQSSTNPAKGKSGFYHPYFTGTLVASKVTSNGGSVGLLAPSQVYCPPANGQGSTGTAATQHDRIKNWYNNAGLLFVGGTSTVSTSSLSFFDIKDKTYKSAFYSIRLEPYGSGYRWNIYVVPLSGSERKVWSSGVMDIYDVNHGYVALEFYYSGGIGFNPITKQWDLLFTPTICCYDGNYSSWSTKYTPNKINKYQGSDNLFLDGGYTKNRNQFTEMPPNNYISSSGNDGNITPYGRGMYTIQEAPLSTAFSHFIDGSGMSITQANYTSEVWGAEVTKIEHNINV